MPEKPAPDSNNSEKLDETGLTSDPRESVKKFLSGFESTSFTQVNPNSLNDEEKTKVLDLLKTAFRTKLQANDDDMYSHLIFFLIRTFRLTTSPLVEYVGSYSYVLDKRRYEVQDAWIYNTIKHIMAGMNKQNEIKAFCASVEDLYLLAAKLVPNVFKSRAIGKRGAPKGFEYLTADFLTCTSDLMDDYQRSISLSASRNALERSATNSGNGKLVSLYDYGKYISV